MTDETDSKMEDAPLCSHLKRLCFSSCVASSLMTAADVIFAL